MKRDRYHGQNGESAEHALRDLMGLLALPALWAGGDGKAIVILMTQAVERIVPLGICHADVSLLPPTAALIQMRLRGRDLGRDELVAWRDTIESWHQMAIGTGVRL